MYQFRVHDGEDVKLCHELYMPTLDSLRSEAVRFAGDLVASGATNLWSDLRWTMDVTTDAGAKLFTLVIMVVDAAATL